MPGEALKYLALFKVAQACLQVFDGVMLNEGPPHLHAIQSLMQILWRGVGHSV